MVRDIRHRDHNRPDGAAGAEKSGDQNHRQAQMGAGHPEAMLAESMNILDRVQCDACRQKKQREDEDRRPAHIPETENAEKTVPAPVLRYKPEDEQQEQHD